MLKPACVLLLGLVTTSLAKMEGFIVGGSFAEIEKHPHSAFLTIHCVSDDGVTSGWICGSSIVNQHILLTAAHCLFGCSYNSHIGVNLGNENRQSGQVYFSYSFAIHEEYNPQSSANDLCLIRLEKPILLGKRASRVALMRRPPYSEKATVAGWGAIDVSIKIV